ncbi:MAG: ATP synthase F1 subunit gamma [Acidobacteriota bacterium]|jgi:F-type H+-transporting ATPase subunit gamma
MPNLRDIRRRIRSVKNTQQITKAMKMVAAAKLRRAQDAIIHARPYANKMLQVLNSLASRVDRDRHPLLAERPERRIRVVVVAADRGLCGAFNANIQRYALAFLREQKEKGVEVMLEVVGRKARDFFRRREFPIDRQWINVFTKVRYENADDIAENLIAQFADGEADAIYVIYNEFKSVISQKLTLERVLPISKLEFDKPAEFIDYLYEPSDQELFETLLPRHVTFQIYRALLESAAAEQGARMAAMEGATKNAKDMIDRLTLNANRVRQAAITKEIIEIVSGAQALES